MDRRRLASTLGALAVDFGNRDLGLLGIARVGISFASWCLAIALGVYGFEVGGAVAVGVVALVRLLPGALASPFAGLLGDRFSRRDVLIGSGLAITVVLAADQRRRGHGQRRRRRRGRSPGSSPRRSAATCRPRRRCCRRSPAARRSCRPANVTHSTMDNVGFLAAALTTGLLLPSAGPATVFGVAAAVALITTPGLTADRARRATRLRRPTARSPGSCASRCSASGR